MFTGIIESLGTVHDIEIKQSNISIWIKSDFHIEVSIDQSIAHNGICLTVDRIESENYRVTAIAETIEKTTISNWKIGHKINLERCLKLGSRLDGHIVQGHVDTKAICTQKIDRNGSTEFKFKIEDRYSHLIIEKGSITIDGISLTCHSLDRNIFSVSIIPYTFQNTIAQNWIEESISNIEFDIIGKYLDRRNSTS